MRITPVVVGLGCLAWPGCGGGGGASPAQPGAAAPTQRFSVTGSLTDRIDGSPIGGSTVHFRGLSGPAAGITATAQAAGASYSLGELPAGSYEVTITGASHVEHKNLAYRLTQARNDFTVLEWGSCAEGACYDQQFHEYFEWIARAKAIPSQSGRVIKWTSPPRQIWVINEPHMVDNGTGALFPLPGLSPGPFEEFMTILEQVNNERVPAMFCGRTGPLPIVQHAAVQRLFEPSIITIRFSPEGSGAAQRFGADSVATAAEILYYAGPLPGSHAAPVPAYRSLREYDVAHELFHVVPELSSDRGASLATRAVSIIEPRTPYPSCKSEEVRR
jgi:hypothetical protein